MHVSSSKALILVLILPFFFVGCADVEEFFKEDSGSSATGAKSPVNVDALRDALFAEVNRVRQEQAVTAQYKPFSVPTGLPIKAVPMDNRAQTHAQAAADENFARYMDGRQGDINTGYPGHKHYVNHIGATEMDRQIDADNQLGFRIRENLYSSTDPTITGLTEAMLAREIIESYLSSYAHRDNLYWPYHISVGIGIATGIDSRGRKAIFTSIEFICTNC